MSVVINGNTGITAPSPFVLEGSTSGTVTVAAPAVAGSNTQTLVAATGTLAPLIADTAKSATSTSVDFTGIPSWVKRITVMFNVVSTSGTSPIQIQLGDAGGVETTSYAGSAVNIDGAIGGAANSTGFQLSDSIIAASTMMGIATITLLGSNLWVFNFTGALGSGAGNNTVGAGVKTLSDTLDRVRITTVNGTDTFDAGTINILYE
jgi:hypothetical protein